MRQLFLPVAFLFFCVTAKAQMPELSVQGQDAAKVSLEKLDVDVRVVGTIATTTWTMIFRNAGTRILEGELTFPLPEGITVSRYAIDINGRLREAVPVDKARGTTVLEAIESRRIDPGLLERVDGNSFRTRVYPLNPGGTRTVLIAYEENLQHCRKGGHSLQYLLPLKPRIPIPQLTINVSVLQVNAKPESGGGGNDMEFDSEGKSWTARKTFTNYNDSRPLSFNLPADGDVPVAMMQAFGNHFYYLINTPPMQGSHERALPDSITILWDASLSGRFRNRKAELDLLDAYFRKVNTVAVNLVVFRNEVQQRQAFSVRDGNWNRLRMELETTAWDGGTQLGSLNIDRLPGKEFLLFSDGVSTFGRSDVMGGKRPVYCITSSPQADYPALKYLALQSGGALINLSAGSDAAALAKTIFSEPLRFLGVRASDNLEDSYPSVPVSAANGLSVSGIAYTSNTEVILQYGYGSTVTKEQHVQLNAAAQNLKDATLDRIWAGMKIADLDLRYDANKALIESLGKRYGLITRNTSLIVLESVADYLRYSIEPPEELRQEYDRAIKERGDQRLANRQNREAVAESSLNDLMSWWNENFIPQPKPVRAVIPITTPERRSPDQAISVTHRRYKAPLIDRGNRQERASSANVEHLADASTADVVPLGENVHANKSGAINIGGGRTTGNTVIIDGAQYPSGTLGAQIPPASAPAQVSAYTSGVSGTYGDVTGGVVDISRDGEHSVQPRNSSIHLSAFQFDTAIINKLRRVPADKQYERYLELRKDRINTPAFYFQVAAFFFAQKKNGIGLRILSNLAELDLENYEVTKMLAYKLKELGEAEAAASAFKKVVQWRSMDPQSYRDYGLALADAGHYQQALDTLYTALTGDLDESLQGSDAGIEEPIVTEINNLIALHGKSLNTGKISRNIIQNTPADIRVALSWNMKNTDIDLWVTDPNGEKCYYGHNRTEIGGRISKDITQGFGPEQFMLRKAIPGKYKVEVNYYGDRQIKIAGATTVMAEVFTGWGTPKQKRQIMVLQLAGKEQGGVFIGEFDFRR